MTRDYLDLAWVGDFDWRKEISDAARPIRSNTQNFLLTRHQYGISVLLSQTSFRGETSGEVAKCQLFTQASYAQSQYF